MLGGAAQIHDILNIGSPLALVVGKYNHEGESMTSDKSKAVAVLKKKFAPNAADMEDLAAFHNVSNSKLIRMGTILLSCLQSIERLSADPNNCDRIRRIAQLAYEYVDVL
jgi:hypothetical protein